MQIRAFKDTGQEISVQPTVPLLESRLARPRIDYMVDRNLWIVLEEYRYPHDSCILVIPYGFTFNLASIPRIIWPLVSSFELGLVGPLVHDYLYGCGGRPPEGGCLPPRSYTRVQADVLFKGIMKDEKVPGWRWRLAYQVVRWFGTRAWRA